MTSTPARMRGLSLGVKLSLQLILLTTLALVGLIAVVASMTTRAFDEKGEEEMVARTAQLVTSIDMFQRGLREAAVPLNAMFAELYPEKFTLDATRSVDIGGTPTPLLLHGRQPVNLDFSVVDRYTRATGGVATVFARKGDDFVRVATSLKKESGERAVGTLLGSAHPAYARMLAGEPYVGRATLFGREFMTRYLPVRSETGQVIAILFTARDFTDGLKLLQETIAKEKVGHSGYFYVVDTRSGPGFGNFVIHPTLAGKSALELKDAGTGEPFVKAMIERKRGRVDYTTTVGADAASGAQPKIAVFDHYPEWGWLVAGTVLRNDFTHDSDDLRNRLVWMALGLIVLLAAATTFAVRTMVRRPLAEAAEVAARVADGDLTSAIRVHSRDEVGRMLEGLDQMQRKLRRIVGGIHGSAEAISAASQQIAAGNGDLAQRTETQAASLEQTASSMEELATTVRQNADSARQANVVASEATEIATRGGAVVAEVVGTMDEISAASTKIADIIGVIDGIAFQTNILALNAAVEAARAGEQGRGFAVVAAEVRSLAQRSAAAAREIKELIGASVASVESGAKRVEAAGSTIDEVVQAVRRVAGIVAEIATASQQQAAGISEVHGAITEMDETTRQNAALVEEAAAAAGALEEQAQALVREVATFKTGEPPPAARAAAEVLERALSASRQAVHAPPAPRPAALLPGRPARTRQSTGGRSDDWRRS